MEVLAFLLITGDQSLSLLQMPIEDRLEDMDLLIELNVRQLMDRFQTTPNDVHNLRRW
jgi:hypothetical protein